MRALFHVLRIVLRYLDQNPTKRGSRSMARKPYYPSLIRRFWHVKWNRESGVVRHDQTAWRSTGQSAEPIPTWAGRMAGRPSWSVRRDGRM